MKRLSLFLLFFLPALSIAQSCESPWEEIPSPVPQVISCRLSVPHGWLVFYLATDDVEIPLTHFYPDEEHEWQSK